MNEQSKDRLIQSLKNDIRDCQQMMSVLEREHYHLSRVMQSARIGSWSYHIPTGVMSLDETMLKLYELKREDLKGTLADVRKYVHGDDYARLRSQIENFVLIGTDPIIEYNFRAVTPSNTVKTIAGHATLATLCDGSQSLIGLDYDISELENARTQSVYRSNMEDLLLKLSLKIIRAKGDELDEVINKALRMIGSFVGADRAYRFSYDFDAGTASNTHEWCAEGIQPEIENLQNTPSEDIPLWVSAHKKGLPFYVTRVDELPEQHGLREILEPQGIKSLISIPLMEHGSCIGFIGFDAVREVRHWSQIDIDLLTLLADLLVNAGLNRKHEIAIAKAQEELMRSRDTAQFLATQAMAASDARSRFVARISHEIRTPLHAILGMADLASKQNNPEETAAYLAAIKSSGITLLDLINDVLDFSKQESSDVQLSSGRFCLHELLDTVIKLFKPLADQKDIALELETNFSGSEFVTGDALRLKQVLNNLISNAIKFTIRGRIIVTARLQKTSPNSDALIEISVSDTGVGINESDIPHLFDPFFQADDSSTRQYGGTGLGLTIVKMLVTKMDGEIDVRSTRHVGSTFTVRLTLPSSTVEPQQSHLLPVQTDSNFLTDKVLLLAEDNPINAQLVRSFLKDYRCEIHVVNNGQEAVSALLDQRYDLVLMDCQMPVMDGFEATRIIRMNHGSITKLPIIAVTASALEDDKSHCLAVGMDDVLTKPFSKRELLTKLQSWLDHSDHPHV